MANTLLTVAGAGLVNVKEFVDQATPLTAEARSELLRQIEGVLYTSHNRPPVMVLFEESNLPRPSEIAMYKGDDTVYADTQMPADSTLARVVAYIWRRLADDAYILHLHPTRTFFFVISGAPRHPLLDMQLRSRMDVFVMQEWFPIYMWNTQRTTRVPNYFEHNEQECVYYGEGWTATLRLCEDCVVRPTRWCGIALATVPQGLAVVGSETRPMLMVPQKTDGGSGCDIRPLMDYRYASAKASPPADRG